MSTTDTTTPTHPTTHHHCCWHRCGYACNPPCDVWRSWRGGMRMRGQRTTYHDLRQPMVCPTPHTCTGCPTTSDGRSWCDPYGHQRLCARLMDDRCWRAWSLATVQHTTGMIHLAMAACFFCQCIIVTLSHMHVRGAPTPTPMNGCIHTPKAMLCTLTWRTYMTIHIMAHTIGRRQTTHHTTPPPDTCWHFRHCLNRDIGVGGGATSQTTTCAKGTLR